MDEGIFSHHSHDLSTTTGPGDADDLDEEGFEEVEAEHLDEGGAEYRSEPDELDLELEDLDYDEEIDDEGYDIDELEEEEEALYEDDFFNMDFDEDDMYS